jgi:hypothetical protein
MIEPDEIRSVLRDVLAHGLRAMARSSATAEAFAHGPERLHPQVIVRHLIEHVFRIRMFRPLDVRAMQLLVDAESGAAAEWGRYARSEAVHDRYFLRDLEAIGVDRSSVEKTTPFPSTRELVGFVDRASRHYGPLPVILYSFWAEENSDIGSARVIERTQHLYGRQAVKGASAHRSLDDTMDHAGVIVAVLAAIVRDADELYAAAEILDRITRSIGDYFSDLDAWSRSVAQVGTVSVANAARARA